MTGHVAAAAPGWRAMYVMEIRNADGSRAKSFNVERAVAVWVSQDHIDRESGETITGVVGMISAPGGGPLLPAETQRFLGYAEPDDPGFGHDKSPWHQLARDWDAHLQELEAKAAEGATEADPTD